MLQMTCVYKGKGVLLLRCVVRTRSMYCDVARVCTIIAEQG